MHVFNLYAEESKSKANPLFEQRFKHGLDIVNEEIVYRTKNGKKVYGLLSSSLIRDRNDQVIASRSIVRDITEHKELAEERERLLLELEGKTKELEQLVYVVSHDLRSSLVNIQGFSKELDNSLKEMHLSLQNEDIPADVKDRINTTLNKEAPEMLHYILTSSSKIGLLLSGMLRLSRLGRAVLTIEDLDINELVAGAIMDYGYRAEKAGVAFEVENLPPCRGDSIMINQVFSNLVSNALNYLDPERQGVIRISGTKVNDRVIYCIEDNGIGIARQNQEVIFKAFNRVHPDAGSGEGLGLAIVRKSLSLNDGKVWLESEPGRGSKFFVSLPVAKGQEVNGGEC